MKETIAKLVTSDGFGLWLVLMTVIALSAWGVRGAFTNDVHNDIRKHRRQLACIHARGEWHEHEGCSFR